MNKLFIIIFGLLAVAFIAVTVVKQVPENQPLTSEPTELEKKISKRDSEVILFWQHYDKATELRNRGEYTAALNFYRKALGIDTTHQNSLYYLGNMQLAKRDFTGAESSWKKLTIIHDQSARGQLQLGNLYSCKSGDNPLYDLSQAEKRFETAAILNAEETGPRLQLAKIQIINEDYDRAEQMLNNVISSNFRSVEAYFLNGYLRWHAGDTVEAEQQLQKAVAIHSQSSEETSNVGEGETKAGNSPMLASSFRCSLFTGHIEEELENMDETHLTPDAVYRRFEDKISEY